MSEYPHAVSAAGAPRSTHPRRWRRGIVVLGAGVFVAGVLAVRAFRPKARGVYAVAPLGHTQAVFATRRNEDDATTDWLQLDDADGTVRWSFDTGTHRVLDTLGETAVAATKHRIYAFLEPGYRGPHDSRLVAFDRASGRRVWEKVVDTHLGPNVLFADSPTLLVDADRVYVARCRDNTGHVDAYARGSGAHEWSRTRSGALCGDLIPFGSARLLARRTTARRSS